MSFDLAKRVPKDLSYRNVVDYGMKDFFRNADGTRMSDENIATFRNDFRKALQGGYGYYDGNPQTEDGLSVFSREQLGMTKDVTGTSGMTTTVGLQGVPIQMPAQILAPLINPLARMFPRRVVGGRTVTWRQLIAPLTTQWGSVPEAGAVTTGRNAPLTYNEANQLITFHSIEAETFLTPEALFGGNSSITPGQDFNVGEINSLYLLMVLLQSEEYNVLGGNTVLLATPATPTASATQPAASAGTLTPGAAYSVKVAALSLQGLNNALSARGGGNTGTPTTGDNLGESIASSVLTVTLAGSGAGSTALAFQWAAPTTGNEGVAGYAIYGYSSTAVRYIGVSYTNTYTLTALGSSTNTVNTTDLTANANDSPGLIQLALDPTASGYIKSLDGGALTGDSNTGVQQFYDAFKYFYDTWRIAPDFALMGSNVYGKSTRIITGSSQPGFTRFIGTVDASTPIKGGLFVGPVQNEFGAQLGKPECERILHPLMPQGMVVFGAMSLGPMYPNANVGANIQRLLGWDYRRDTFGKQRRLISEEMMDVNGATAVYFQRALGAIVNIGT